MKSNLFMTVDVEDYFQVENFKSVIQYQDWNRYELRVEKNIDCLLEIFDTTNTKATFFVLGWIAEKRPDMVKKISAAGHEIASHGCNHNLLYNMKKSELKDDLLKSREILEDLISEPVVGYRAPSFSITEEAIVLLKETGYQYDSSCFNIPLHPRYSHLKSADSTNEMIFRHENGLLEFSLSTVKTFGFKLPWSGGGYFRMMPYCLFKHGFKKAAEQNNGAIFYLHPWEVDALQPKIKGIKHNYAFRHYVGLSKNKHKIEQLTKDFTFTSLSSELGTLGIIQS